MRVNLGVFLCVVVLASMLRAQSEEFGKWISLFDGKDTTGWVNAKPDDARHKGPSQWLVEDDGALTNGKAGVNDASSRDEFGDYELELEYKVPQTPDHSGNSGIYLRGVIEVQVFDSYGKAQPGEGDAGAVYGGFKPLKNASKPAGEWNSFRIIHLGHNITVYHNGTLAQDNIWRDTPTPGAMQINPITQRKLDGLRGPILLQGDHSKVWYRNIRIRPLVSSANGWRSLWNGKDLTELDAHGDGRARAGLRWQIEDHSFTNKEYGGKGHDIWTRESFGNCLVHYEYRSDPNAEGGNSGFYLRDQWEIQIYKTSSTDPHSDGSLYSIHPPTVLACNEPGQWNVIDAKVQGMKIWVWENGKLIHDGKVLKTRTDNHGSPTEQFTKAPFKLQGDHGKVWFKNLFLKPLPDGE